MDNTWIVDTIRAPQPGDALGACIADALQVGTRVVPQPTPLHLALLDAVARSTTWR